MPANNHYEQQFLDALKDVFVGAEVEGDSGYINLMKIKSRYYTEGVFPCLIKDVDAACKPFEPSFREELFDKLYDFFKRYFSESGSIYFRHTPLHNNVYEKVYTDDRDVMLFWKTHMLYYVKTDRLFNSMDVDIDGTAFFFDVSELEHKRANEKRELMYGFKGYKDGKIILTVAYSEKGRKTKTDEILRALKEKGITLDEESLERAFRVFEKQSEVDYFINKNAKAFLKEQFDLWLYQYVFSGESAWTETRLKQLQAIKTIAYSIIDFIAQFEDELVRIWNKPKFVLNSHYVITLDKITDPKLLKRILAHKGMQAQLQEWRDLGMVDARFNPEKILEKDLLGEPANAKYQFLPIDTRHFPDLELDVLALFDDLDSALDGWLVHSENYQALNTLLPKFREQLTAIYIDPPYNTGGGEFIYENRFQHSSWLTMIENRLRLAYPLLRSDGILCATIDDYELRNLLLLFDTFIDNHLLGTVPIKSKPQGRATARGFSINHEYAIFVAKSSDANVGRLPRTGTKAERYPEKDEGGIFAWTNFRGTGANSTRKDRPKLFYPIFVKGERIRVPRLKWNSAKSEWDNLDKAERSEEIIWPVDSDGQERVWTLGWERATEDTHELKVIRGTSGTQINRKYRPNYEGALPGTWWDSTLYSASESGTRVLQSIFGVKNDQSDFSFPKSIHAVVDCLRSCGMGQIQRGLALDFFAGSGTTAHAVINLNREDSGRRRYILVEMGEHFNTVILPRIKKVVYSDKWKDGKAQEAKGISHFCKYYDLEQYEDALRCADYKGSGLFAAEDAYNSYVFMRDLKMLEAVSLDKKKNQVDVYLDKLYEGIDVAETLSCVTGKGIKRITRETVEFQDGTSAILTNPDWTLVKPLVWW